VVEDIPAGYIPSSILQIGQAARIATGGMIPKGADAVIPVEITSLVRMDPGSKIPRHVLVYSSVKMGDFIRPKGLDVGVGEHLLRSNKRLRPQDIGIIAA
jgi:molybdopterin molybdotransferase